MSDPRCWVGEYLVRLLLYLRIAACRVVIFISPVWQHSSQTTHPEMKGRLRFCQLFAVVLRSYFTAGSILAAESPSLMLQDPSNSSSLNLDVRVQVDPHFSAEDFYGEIDLPLSAVFMNAVELMAQYAEMDFGSRTRQRHGVVLPRFPQVEIAVIPASPATTIETRFVVWGLYDTVIDMVYRKKFKEIEIALKWSGQVVAHLYFTKPLDENMHTGNLTVPIWQNQTSFSDASNVTFNADIEDIGRFDWRPYFKPNGNNLVPKSVFVLAMGALRAIAEHATSEKVDSPLHIGSEIVDANMQVYFWHRRSPRTRAPFFLYGHVLEVVRRTPGWMLERERFAEFFCEIGLNARPLGLVLMEKGQFNPQPTAADGPAANS